MTIRRLSMAMAGMALVLGTSACGDTRLEPPEPYVTDRREILRERYGSIFGGDEGSGIVLFSTRGTDGADGSGGGGSIGVNPFLWRASLETIDFMPLTQTDPLGGVIITDWYAPPETPDERFKLNVYVLDQSLRADGVKVSVFRQTRADGGWTDEAVDPKTARTIEDNILTRARELRVASLEAAEG
jgi:hypothetical protein